MTELGNGLIIRFTDISTISYLHKIFQWQVFILRDLVISMSREEDKGENTSKETKYTTLLIWKGIIVSCLWR